MTGYTVHTGSTKKFASGWERIFGGGKRRTKPAAKKSAATKARKKPK